MKTRRACGQAAARRRSMRWAAPWADSAVAPEVISMVDSWPLRPDEFVRSAPICWSM